MVLEIKTTAESANHPKPTAGGENRDGAARRCAQHWRQPEIDGGSNFRGQRLSARLDARGDCLDRNSIRGFKMRIVTVALVLIAAGSGPASAQRSRADSIHTPARIEMLTKQLRDLLFRGIPLSASEDSSARTIIRDAVIRRDSLDATAPSFHEQAVMLVQRRDSLLRQLLTSDDAQRRFAINASARMLILDGEVQMIPPRSDD
jgi:hypothetical protein